MNDVEVNFTAAENGTTASSKQPIPIQVFVILAFSFLSAISCAMILVTYGMFKELRSLPGKILMNLASALLVASSLTVLSLFVADKILVCRALAVILHYAYVAEFFWTSVLSFEIARALHQVYHALVGRSETVERFGLLSYVIVGWGLPLLVILYSLALHFATGGEYVQYGGRGVCDGNCPDQYCFITEFRGYVISLYVPVGASLLFSFGAAGFSCYVITRATVTRYKQQMHHSIVYIRALIPVISITGVVYVLSAVFFSLHAAYGYQWALQFFVGLGTVQGFIVCIVFIFKRRIGKLYQTKCMSCCRGNTTTNVQNKTRMSLVPSNGSSSQLTATNTWQSLARAPTL